MKGFFHRTNARGRKSTDPATDPALEKRLVKLTRRPWRVKIIRPFFFSPHIRRRIRFQDEETLSRRSPREIRDVESMGTSRASVLKRTFSLFESKPRPPSVYRSLSRLATFKKKRLFPSGQTFSLSIDCTRIETVIRDANRN